MSGAWFRWCRRVAILAAGGVLFQTSCSTLAAGGVAGIAASISNEYLRQVISDWLNISTGLPF